jgi:hypothetical protein
MGGRGSSSGISDNGKKYGTEYTTLYKSGNIKFVRYNDSTAAKAPMETMTKGRVYVTVDSRDNLKSITYHDTANKRNKQIDLDKPHSGMKPHTHHGYIHNENDGKKGAANLTTEERKMVDRIEKIWYNRNNK